ncbi:MAG: anthranilate synthase component I [Planctomycetota bacterium]|nr:MAG: anthranilate synthase component I [Planctomycetota bacterium]
MGASDSKVTSQEKRFHIVSSDLPFDLETPVSTYLKLRDMGATFLLESAADSGRLGRYSFIGFVSGRTLSADRKKTVYRDGDRQLEQSGDPLSIIRAIIESTTVEANGHEVPVLLGAAVGYIGYDYVQFVEGIPIESTSTPLCQFHFVESLIEFDHFKRQMKVYSLVPESSDGKTDLHEKILCSLETSLPHRPKRTSAGGVKFSSNTSEEEYEETVNRAKRYIYEGDCFQIVVSRRLSAPCTADAFDIYRHLRINNPSPYMFYLDFGNRKIIGSSPEVLVKLTGRTALISPIAGTRPRSTDIRRDTELEAELLADEKERAEHTMLVDLARNDVGRVCKYGTVKVDGLMRIERYSHVMHIVSDVRGELLDDVDQFDLFRASFPAGTVTGAPKVRAMEIIDGLEKQPRGFYAGAVGYFSPTGDMDTCISIRTILVEDDTVHLQAGAGIVADSDPAYEFTETENKLAALKEAVKNSEGELI